MENGRVRSWLKGFDAIGGVGVGSWSVCLFVCCMGGDEMMGECRG